MNNSTSQAGPSSHQSSTTPNGRTDLWSEILRSADRRNSAGRENLVRKNVVLLAERHRGRRYLLDRILAGQPGSGKRVKPGRAGVGADLALGYEVMQVREDGDEDSVPPVSVFYPPSSHRTMTKLVPLALPHKSLSDTAVVIVLDWTKPSLMVKELITWLLWVEDWTSNAAEKGELDELRDRLQSHVQHYVEPAPNSGGSSTSSGVASGLSSIVTAYGGGPLLPLGPGTLTLNHLGVPIIVVCTRADLMDTAADEIGIKGGAWEERTDWIQQVLRSICLSYGAALFYTASSQPHTYSLFRSYLLHRLHTLPPPLNPASDAPAPATSTRFPFSHRANVFDRDCVMVPSGWDSWGKINVLRDGFDPGRIGKAWETSLRRGREGSKEVHDGDEGLEDLWIVMIPDVERGPKPNNPHTITTTAEPEQTFLTRQLDFLLKDPNRDPRTSFRTAAAVTASAASSAHASAHPPDPDRPAGIVGPMGTGGLSLPGVEKAMKNMEGESADDLREKFAKLGRKESARGAGAVPGGAGPGDALSPSVGPSGTTAVPNEALHNFFQGLLATKSKSSTGASARDTKDSKSIPPVDE